MDGNYQNTSQITTSTTNVATTATAAATTSTTFGSLGSSGSEQYIEGLDMEVLDYFTSEDWAMGESNGAIGGFGQENKDLGCQGNEFFDLGATSNNQMEGDTSGESSIIYSGKTKETKEKVAFRMKSEILVPDDGYKWRKYGKKMVKNSPNPRNYYKCSAERCPVKKRVERDREDPSYVITTYEGHHNHEIPK